MSRRRGQFSWEGAERHARMVHAVRLVRRVARREVVASEFNVSCDVLRKWVERLKREMGEA